MFVLDFAPQHFEIDAEVAELAQFWYCLAPTGETRFEVGASPQKMVIK